MEIPVKEVNEPNQNGSKFGKEDEAMVSAMPNSQTKEVAIPTKELMVSEMAIPQVNEVVSESKRGDKGLNKEIIKPSSQEERVQCVIPLQEISRISSPVESGEEQRFNDEVEVVRETQEH